MSNISEPISYQNYGQWKLWDPEKFGCFNRKEHYYFRKLVTQYINRDSPQILEIGFGNGAFAGWLRENKSDASWSGVEIQSELVRRAKKLNFNATSALPTPHGNRKFDLIVAFDVIEHLPDHEIQQLFNHAKHLLNPNGAMITRTPNAGGPMGLPNQTGDPTHVTPISRSRLAAYLGDWEIAERGDIQPIWEGKLFSAARNALRLMARHIIVAVIRFAFSPQPKTFLSSNLHLFFTLRPNSPDN